MLVEPVRHRVVARRAVGVVARAGRPRSRCPRPRARSSAARVRLVRRRRATISIPSRPWTLSSSACRFDPVPEARTATRNAHERDGQHRVRPARGRQAPASISSSMRSRISARRMCDGRAVRRQPVVGVALRSSACARRAGSAAHVVRPTAGCAVCATERIASSSDGDRHRVGRRKARAASPSSQTSQHAPSAMRRRARRRSGAGSARAGSRRPRRTPRCRGTGASGRARRRPSTVRHVRRRAAVERARAIRPTTPLRRRRRRVDDARAREVADERAQLLVAAARSAPRGRHASSVVAAVLAGERRSSASATRAGIASVSSSRLMKCTCSALSRFSASSSARAGCAVATAAPGLLVVGLERRRDAGVDDRPHVRLVHAHAERVRRDDHLDLVREEAPLHLRPLLARQPRVVGAPS